MSDGGLDAVLDRLLPPVDELAGAGALGIGVAMARDPLMLARPLDVEAVLARLPGDFATLAGDARDRALAEVERELPREFATLVNLAYNAYYLDARVLARIERLTGYRARAPQPLGYAVEPLDEALLEPVRRRGPSWREDAPARADARPDERDGERSDGGAADPHPAATGGTPEEVS